MHALPPRRPRQHRRRTSVSRGRADSYTFPRRPSAPPRRAAVAGRGAHLLGLVHAAVGHGQQPIGGRAVPRVDRDPDAAAERDQFGPGDERSLPAGGDVVGGPIGDPFRVERFQVVQDGDEFITAVAADQVRGTLWHCLGREEEAETALKDCLDQARRVRNSPLLGLTTHLRAQFGLVGGRLAEARADLGSIGSEHEQGWALILRMVTSAGLAVHLGDRNLGRSATGGSSRVAPAAAGKASPRPN